MVKEIMGLGGVHLRHVKGEEHVVDFCSGHLVIVNCSRGSQLSINSLNSPEKNETFFFS